MCTCTFMYMHARVTGHHTPRHDWFYLYYLPIYLPVYSCKHAAWCLFTFLPHPLSTLRLFGAPGIWVCRQGFKAFSLNIMPEHRNHGNKITFFQFILNAGKKTYQQDQMVFWESVILKCWWNIYHHYELITIVSFYHSEMMPEQRHHQNQMGPKHIASWPISNYPAPWCIN